MILIKNYLMQKGVNNCSNDPHPDKIIYVNITISRNNIIAIYIKKH
jgi:hypothetical protein